jgi:hypothetical protein
VVVGEVVLVHGQENIQLEVVDLGQSNNQGVERVGVLTMEEGNKVC